MAVTSAGLCAEWSQLTVTLQGRLHSAWWRSGYSKSWSYREDAPSLWSQDPFAPHKCHQPQLEQNGFNQLRHPHSPGSGATKRLGSCPQRTVRLMCPSTLQGPGWAGRGGGRRQGGRKWRVARTQESKGALASSCAPGPSPNTPAPYSLAQERSWKETGEQVPAAGEAAAAVSFTNKYTSLPS